jgi:hypothetical protein
MKMEKVKRKRDSNKYSKYTDDSNDEDYECSE